MARKNSWRRNNIGRRMNEAIRLFESRIVENLKSNGHDQLTVTHINLTRNLDEEGTRLTELAKRACMTKQSMSELVAQVERTGLVVRRPDPADGRAKLVCFTRKGFTWLKAFRRSLNVAEREMRAEIGSLTVDSMVKSLAKYVDAPQRRSGKKRS